MGCSRTNFDSLKKNPQTHPQNPYSPLALDPGASVSAIQLDALAAGGREGDDTYANERHHICHDKI